MKKITAILFIFFIYQPLGLADLSLTASDGSGLELKSFKAKVVLEGMFAFTEIDMVFHNPENRQREGRFQITLPQGAAISRFAMSRGNQLLEGEVVERKLAQRAYEDFLHQRQDPALLEVDQGNRFNARVFPIFAGENKRIIVSYSQTLGNGQYVLPLKDLPVLDDFSLYILHDTNFADSKQPAQTISGLDAQVSSNQVIKVNRKKYRPENDFVMPISQNQQLLAVRSDTIMATRIVPFPKSDATKSAKPQNWVLLVDTSASQAPYLDHTLQQLARLKDRLNPKQWQVFSFDQMFRQHQSLKQISDIQALGASDLQQAFEQLAKQSFKDSHLLIVSDAVATAGQTEAHQLEQLLKQITGVSRVDVLLPSTHHDYELANTLRLSAADPGVITDLREDAATVSEKLLTANHAKIAVEVANSKWFWPKTIAAVQAGEAVTIFAELEASQAIQIKVGDRSFSPTAVEIEPLLLKREWARARVDRLSALIQQATDQDMREAMLQQIIKISVDERIITPYTALLVLESAADYQRYGIEPHSMADILTIGIDGISVSNRTPLEQNTPVLPGKLPMSEEPNFEDSISTRRKMQDKSGELDQGLVSNKQEAPARPSPAVSSNSFARSVPPPPASTQPMEEEKSTAAPRQRMNRADVLQDQAQAFNSAESMARREPAPGARAPEKAKQISPWVGDYKTFRELLAKGKLDNAYKHVMKWRQSQAADVMALIALGEYFEQVKDFQQASRAYGSLIDYFPARADIRRWAAERLLRFDAGYALALDSLVKAVAQRPDHPSGHYLLAWAYWLNNNLSQAKSTLANAAKMNFPRFAGANRILKECLELMDGKVKHAQLRFVLTWETDANDVDFHVSDNKNNHAYYGQPNLASGGKLYYDITTGYGPENFTIENPTHYPYKLSAHYYNMGPMGYGMGVLNIVRYDSNGKIRLEFRPYVVMTNQAFVDLGKVQK